MAVNNATKYMEFGSRQDAYNQLLSRLEKDDGSVMLGIYGTPGIGKTTLVEQVSKKAMELQMFDQVAIINASQIVDARALRLKIGKCLGVEFQYGEENEALEVAQKWAYGAHILIILDDVQNKIPDLEDVGIPFGNNKWGNDTIDEDIRTAPGVDRRVKGCKIMITSETRDVCNINKCKGLFGIEKLEKDEAFELLSQVVGISTIDSLDDKDLARIVCDRCDGLPLDIAVLGNTLRDNSEDASWRATFGQMIFHGRVPLDVSFDALPKDAKLCLLVCSLFDGAGDTMIPIDFLFRTSMGLGLFEGLETVADARYKVESMVAILKSSLLLVEGTYNHVKMHSRVRDVAREVAIKDEEHAFHFEASESKWPRIKDIWGNINHENIVVKLLSLTFDTEDVFEFPDDVDFPNLHTLIVNFKNHSDKIKDDFFNAFVNLKHLMLSSTPVPPSSLGNLEANLRLLSISTCKVDDVSMITRMKNLEMLSFNRVDFSAPINLRNMEQLRILHFTNCNGVALPQHSISSLSNLEELIITDEFSILNEEAEECPIYSELSNLTRLTNLHIYYQLETASFPDEKIWKNLQRYTLSLGENFQNGELVSPSKSLKFCYGNLEGDGIISLVQRSQDLVLQGIFSGFEHCFRIENGKEFAELTWLKLVACYKVKYLGKILQWRLNKVALHSFSNLSVLDISLCTEIKYLFSTSIARGLQQLQELIIFDCGELEEIVWDQSEEECKEVITFPKLTSIDFFRMPNFRSFRSRSIITTVAEADQSLFDEMVKFPALKSVKIYDMSGVHSVFDGKVDFPSMKVLDIYDLENVREIWEIDSEGNFFGELEILKVKNCPQLETLIPSGMLQNLKDLREPIVENCDLLFPLLSEEDEEASSE
ncbi:disease resistance protein At4g27190-like [Apium graveolens]|uniref:disease resistance protein At4g27190-like n=1 Tax=Apium graveolens TaxID=4045 RepID=UPI003D7B2969